MLPKIWKKVLLAVCIIACIFNVMSKLVNRNSLEINLKSVNDGKTIWESLHKKENNNSSDTIEGVHETTPSEEETNTETENAQNEEYQNDDSFVVEL